MIFSLPKVDEWGPLARHTTPQNRLGEYFCDNDDNRLWVYVRANETIGRGAAIQSVAPVTGGNDPNGIQAAAAGSNVIELAPDMATAGQFTELLTRVPQQPQHRNNAMIRIGSRYGVIRSHSALRAEVEWIDQVDDSDSGPPNWGLSQAIAEQNSNNMALSRPWLVELADNINQQVVGFAQRSISAGEYFWALVEGIGIILGDGGAQLAAGIPLRGDSVGGRTSAFGTGNTDNDIPIAYTLDRISSGSFGLGIAAAPTRIGIVPLQKTGRFESSYEHPSAT